MLSSKSLNRPEPSIFGWPKKRSLKAGTLGLCFSVTVFALFQSGGATLWLFLSLISFFVPLFMSEWLFGRNEDWPNKKLETLLISLKPKKQRPLSASLLGLDRLQSFDPHSLYTIDGWEYFGFKPLKSSTQKELRKEAISLLKDLPCDYVVKFIRFNLPHKSEFISTHRPALARLRLIDPGYYVILARNTRLSKDSEKKRFVGDLSSFFTPLNRDDLICFNEVLFNPEIGLQKNTKREEKQIGLREGGASHLEDGRFSWVYPASECYGAASLAELSDEVGEDFTKVFRAFETAGSIGFIMTRFEKHSQTKDEISQAFKTFRLLRSNALMWLSKDTARAEKIRKNLDDRSKGLSASFSMFLNCLVYGHPDEVTKTLKELGKFNTQGSNVNVNRRPIFQIDTGYIRQSLASLAAGRSDYLPLRSQKLDSIEEASFYLPPIRRSFMPEYGEKDHNYPPLIYRSKENIPRPIDHASLEDTPITLLVGKSGYGKSTVLSQMIIAHLKLEELYSRPVAVILGDVGSSGAWLKETGLADLAFDLSKKDGGDYAPLPIHPLHIFFNPRDRGPVKTSELLPARNFLTALVFDKSEKDEFDNSDLIFSALKAMKEGSEKTYELSKFSSYLTKVVNESLLESEKKISSEHAEKFKSLWHRRLLRLSLFCRGGVYGNIFEPKRPEHDSIDHVRVFYYNLEEEDFNSPDLAGAFLTLCYAANQQISSRFKSTNKGSRDVLECIDEFDRQAAFLPVRSLKDKKDQARKYGQIPVISIQSFDYLSRKNEQGAFDHSIYEGIGRTFFWGVGQQNVYSKVAAIFDEPYSEHLGPGPKLSKMLDISAKILEQKKSRQRGIADENAPRPVGYFDTAKTIEELIVDVEPEFLWLTTTKPGGRKIRAFVKDRLNLSLKEACTFLSKRLGPNIPSSSPSEVWLSELVGKEKSEGKGKAKGTRKKRGLADDL